MVFGQMTCILGYWSSRKRIASWDTVLALVSGGPESQLRRELSSQKWDVTADCRQQAELYRMLYRILSWSTQATFIWRVEDGVRNYRSGFNNQKSELGDVLPSQTFTVRQ